MGKRIVNVRCVVFFLAVLSVDYLKAIVTHNYEAYSGPFTTQVFRDIDGMKSLVLSYQGDFADDPVGIPSLDIFTSNFMLEYNPTNYMGLIVQLPHHQVTKVSKELEQFVSTGGVFGDIKIKLPIYLVDMGPEQPIGVIVMPFLSYPLRDDEVLISAEDKTYGGNVFLNFRYNKYFFGSLNVGLIRKSKVTTYENLFFSQESLIAGFAAGINPVPNYAFVSEVQALIPNESPAASRKLVTPIEVRMGGYFYSPNKGIELKFGVGSRTYTTIGAPELRIFAGLNWLYGDRYNWDSRGVIYDVNVEKEIIKN